MVKTVTSDVMGARDRRSVSKDSSGPSERYENSHWRNLADFRPYYFGHWHSSPLQRTNRNVPTRSGHGSFASIDGLKPQPEAAG